MDVPERAQVLELLRRQLAVRAGAAVLRPHLQQPAAQGLQVEVRQQHLALRQVVPLFWIRPKVEELARPQLAVVDELVAGVAQRPARLLAARAREEAGRAALTQARESQRIIRDRYESGLATVTDVLRAAQATLDAESRATSADTDVILGTVALDRALGRL